MGLSEYQRKEFDPNNCHPHHERWEVAITHTEPEFRHALQRAWYNGYSEGQKEMLRSYQTPWQDQFNEWFDKHYGDIIGIG